MLEKENQDSEQPYVELDLPKERFMSIMAQASFKENDSEAVYVSHLVLRNIRTKNIIPEVHRHRGIGLASRCLISLGLFKERMEFLSHHRGYPSPEFYMEMGRRTFFDEGKREVSRNMPKWTEFLNSRFHVKVQKSLVDGLEIPIVYQTAKDHKVYPNSLVWKGQGPIRNNYDFQGLGDEQYIDINPPGIN